MYRAAFQCIHGAGHGQISFARTSGANAKADVVRGNVVEVSGLCGGARAQVGAASLQRGDIFFLHRTVARQHELYLFGGNRFGGTFVQSLQHLHGAGGFGLVAVHFELFVAVGDFHIQGQFDGAQMFVSRAA